MGISKFASMAVKQKTGFSFPGAAKNPLWDYFRKFISDFMTQYAIDEADEKMGTSTKTSPTVGGFVESSIRNYIKSTFGGVNSSSDKNKMYMDIYFSQCLLYQNVLTTKLLDGYKFSSQDVGNEKKSSDIKFISYNMYDNYPKYFQGNSNRILLKRWLLSLSVIYCMRTMQMNLVPFFQSWIDFYVNKMSDSEVKEELSRLRAAQNG